MAQYGLPISDDSKQSVAEGVGDGNGNSFEELDEGFGSGRGSGSGPDDATTYWKSTSFIAIIRNNLTSSLTDPAVSTGHIIRSRVRKSASGGRQIDSLIFLTEAGSAINSGDTLADLSDTWVTHSYTLSGAEADDITDYTNLETDSRGNQVGGGTPKDWHISAQEFECPDAPAAGGGLIYRSNPMQALLIR